MFDRDIIFSTDIDRFILEQEFLEGSFTDLYSGAKGDVVFFKELDIDSADYYTAVITSSGEIGIELLYYSSDSGESCGIFKFDCNAESFAICFEEFTKRLIYLKDNVE